MPSVTTPPATWLPVAAAIHRLAFGASGIPMRWDHEWGVPPDSWAVEALSARASGYAWRPSEPPPSPAYGYRKAVRQLMRKHNAVMPGAGNPRVLLQYARDVAARHAEWEAAQAFAEDRLTAAVRDGVVPAYGIPVEDPYTNPGLGTHEPLSAALLLQPGRVIRLNGVLCWRGQSHYDFGPLQAGPYYADVQVDADAVRRLQPPAALPDADYLSPWEAIAWRAFGTVRPVNLGSRPDTPFQPYVPILGGWDRHAIQMGAWAAFDAAEEELMGLARAGRVIALGRPVGRDGKAEAGIAGTHRPIPAEVFLTKQLSFDSAGALHEGHRGHQTLMRMAGRGGWPLFNDVQFQTVAVAAAWGGQRAEPPAPEPFPDTTHVRPFEAAAWRAFGRFEVPPHVIRHRSFDHGTQRLPDETDIEYARRQAEHRRFDAAERQLMDLLVSGRAQALGRPPARIASGERLHLAGPPHEGIPATTFLNSELAFSAVSELVHRLPMLDRLFSNIPADSDANPDIPLFYEVVIVSAGLREAWGIEGAASSEQVPSPAQPVPVRKISQYRSSYAEMDAPLIVEMHKLIVSDHYSPWSAALALADKAQGKNTKLESRAKRLLPRYSEQFRPEQI